MCGTFGTQQGGRGCVGSTRSRLRGVDSSVRSCWVSSESWLTARTRPWTWTDHHADQLITMAEVLEKQSVDVPVPLAHRLQARAQRLRDLAEKHHRDCITLPEASA